MKLKNKNVLSAVVALSLFSSGSAFAIDNDLKHSKTIDKLQKDLEVLALQSKKAELRKAIFDAQKSEADANASKKKAETPVTIVKPKKKVTHEIYVARVFGVGSQLKAHVMFDKQVMTVEVGDYIKPGVIVNSIDLNGMTVKEGKKIHHIGLTLIRKAFDGAFKVEEEGKAKPTFSARPMNMPRNN